MSIRKPAADGDSVLRVEDVRRRRVVDDDGVLEIATNLGEILWKVSRRFPSSGSCAYLDVVALVVVAALAEETVMHNTVDVQLIKQRVTVLDIVSLSCELPG